MDAEKHAKSDGDFDTKDLTDGESICLSCVGEKTETEVQVEPQPMKLDLR